MADNKAGRKTVVTSFNEEGYKRYGEKFISSYLEHWPKNVRLVVYYEGDGFQFIDGVSWYPIESVEGLETFMKALTFPIQHGLVDGYNINYDARMGRKTYVQCHALKQYGGKVFWVDADTVTHSKIPETFLDEMLPDDKFNCYLGRDGWYYTESGFIGFNSNHEMAEKFMRSYRHVFDTGAIFTLPGWHDCYAFDAVRNACKRPDDFVNLAKDVPFGTMHPQMNCALTKYMHHLKGSRKETGIREGDVVGQN